MALVSISFYFMMRYCAYRSSRKRGCSNLRLFYHSWPRGMYFSCLFVEQGPPNLTFLKKKLVSIRLAQYMEPKQDVVRPESLFTVLRFGGTRVVWVVSLAMLLCYWVLFIASLLIENNKNVSLPTLPANSLWFYLPSSEQLCIRTASTQTGKHGTPLLVVILMFTRYHSISLFSIYSIWMWGLHENYTRSTSVTYINSRW